VSEQTLEQRCDAVVLQPCRLPNSAAANLTATLPIDEIYEEIINSRTMNPSCRQDHVGTCLVL